MSSTKSKDVSSLYSGRTVAKNTIYNLFGYGVPLIVAVVLIPPLIKGLGEERFGILNLAWVVIGYSSFFDFGIGRSLTKIIAEKAKSFGRVDWKNLFIGTMIGTIVQLALPSETGHALWLLLKEAFKKVILISLN